MQSCQKILDYWDSFALQTWLILSSYGIMFAILSFVQDLGGLQTDKRYIKGILAIVLGIIFYFFIGLRHLDGAKKR